MIVNRDQIAEQLESARRDLLDLTLRNPLLKYRPLKAKGLEIPCDSVKDIFVHIVREKHSFSFRPKQSNTNAAGESLSPTNEIGKGTFTLE